MKDNRLTGEELQMAKATRELMLAISKMITDVRPTLLKRFGLDDARTNIVIGAAMALSTSFACKMAMGATFEDFSDDQLLQMIRDTNSKLKDFENG